MAARRARGRKPGAVDFGVVDKRWKNRGGGRGEKGGVKVELT
jgi:hypothetical protein